MNLKAAGFAALAGILLFFVWANRKTAKEHARFTAKDVDDALSEVLSPSAPTHDGWDLFLSWPIDDPRLESIRQECLRICREDKPVPGKDISEASERRVAALLSELRGREESQ